MEFYATFNGIPFSNLEPESICRVVWVSNVEWAHDDQPPPGHTELPICPVCLGINCPYNHVRCLVLRNKVILLVKIKFPL